jgi:acetyltransferase-like isoleucine patch superfamily enzyme
LREISLAQILNWLSAIGLLLCRSNSKLFIAFLRKKGVTIGDGTTFYGRVSIDYTRPCLVEIGRNCSLVDGVILLTHGSDWAVLLKKYGQVISSSGKVILKDNVFVGTNTLILKGVTIGENTIIGAGSVVTHDIPANCVAAGNPCRVIMSLDEYYEKRKKAYIEEAKAYALEIFLKTKKIPKIESFGEERSQFQQSNANKNFASFKPLYDSFEDFLIAAGIPREKVKAMKETM